MTTTVTDDNLVKLIYETYFSLSPRDRQDAEWYVTTEAWRSIRELKPEFGSAYSECEFMMGQPVNVDDQADWVELRVATCRGTVPR